MAFRSKNCAAEAYQTVEGIEFRAITVTAYKGKEGPCIERNHAVIYRGPWKQVVDDDGHTLERGARMAVCDKTFKLYSQAPYAGQFILVPPREEVALENAGVFDCSRDHKRHPRETKGMEYKVTQISAACAGRIPIAVREVTRSKLEQAGRARELR